MVTCGPAISRIACNGVRLSAVIAVEDPGAELLVRIVGHRPDHRERAQRRARERQHVIAILQQHQALRRELPCQRQVLRARHRRERSGVRDRALEQSQPELHAQHVAHRRIERGLVDALLGQQLGQVIAVRRARHLHVDAGTQRFERGVLLAGGKAMHDHVDDRFPVADDEARESPFVTQHGLHQEPVARRGHAVDVAEGGHEGRDARIHRRLEGRHVDVAQVDLGDVRRSRSRARLRSPRSRRNAWRRRRSRRAATGRRPGSRGSTRRRAPT